jgi:hypothetical protein
MRLQVCSNMAAQTSPLFARQPVPYSLTPKVSNQRSLEAAVKAAAELLNKVVALLLRAVSWWCCCCCSDGDLKSFQACADSATSHMLPDKGRNGRPEQYAEVRWQAWVRS